MRDPIFRGTFDPSDLIVDNFAGGGGASTGIETAIGRPVDIAINHDAEAIAMHKANHPETRHFQENIWEVDPKEACGGRRVGVAWFSPDCKHFSRAKGSPLRDQGIRGLAWIVIRWAKLPEWQRPRLIVLENVEEYVTWGPLDEEGRVIPGREGEIFNEWLGQLVGCDYSVEFRSLVAADYGAPTTRRRLFLIARYGSPGIVWPEPTHGKGRAEAWRPASEIIDWSLPCPSIFTRERPLAEATQRRIAEGIKRFVMETAEPFVIPLTHHGYFGGQPVSHPVRTITAANRGELALCAPTLIQRSWGERKGQRPRCLDIGKPLGTIVAGGVKHALVAAFIAKHYGDPARKSGGGRVIGQGLGGPIGTVTSRDHHSLTTAFLTKFYGTSIGQQMDLPLPTVTAGAWGGHLGEVRAFLMKYYGQGVGLSPSDPLHTVTSRHRFGLVTIHGEQYVITDIGLRMLQPHELFAAQGFPTDYVIDPEFNGKPLTKTAQVRLAGNSVPPPPAAAIIRSNVEPPQIEVAA